MSVYIKGKEFYKPTACAPCKIRGWCQLWKQVVLPAHLTHPDCPIVEVSEHGDLIDQEALERHTVAEWFCGRKRVYVPWKAVADAPTIIPADREEKTE